LLSIYINTTIATIIRNPKCIIISKSRDAFLKGKAQYS
jgi:hypothetical protein